jgi:hypothetical protein
VRETSLESSDLGAEKDIITGEGAARVRGYGQVRGCRGDSKAESSGETGRVKGALGPPVLVLKRSKKVARGPPAHTYPVSWSLPH